MYPVTLDIETNGFNPDTIWCAVADYRGKEYVFTQGQEFNQWVGGLPEGTPFYAHNGLAFDYPVLASVWGTQWGGCELRDTLVMSRLAMPSRNGGHSLAAWGERLGFPKGDHSDWSQYSPEMLEYCKQDVKVSLRLLQALEGELAGFSEESIALEHDTARIIARQRARGWLLHEQRCYDLLATLRDRQHTLETQVREVFVPYPKAVREITPTKTAKGGWNRSRLGPFRDDPKVVAGPFTAITFPEFNLGSRKQIGEYLVRFGWKPKNLTETGQPIVDEGTLEKIEGIPEAKLISEFLMVQKRIAQVSSWLDAMEEDGRVHGNVNSNGAVTGRMTHSGPNLAQVPAGRAPYGLECRACWVVGEGYVLVGCDAEGLELRCLAHYMNDPEFTFAVVSGRKEDGTDVHTVNMRAAGLTDRDQAKTFIYAFLYGAGDALLGAIVGGGRKEGAALKAKFLDALPALKDLRDRVQAAAARGWLKGLDGRKVYVRSAHAALNTLLQSAGAIIMKKALVILDTYATRNNYDYEFVGNIHDEFQAEVLAKDGMKFGRLANAAIEAAGVHYNFRCTLAGSFDIGSSWAETH